MRVERLMDLIGADFYTGVPDSQLKALCNCLMSKYGIDPVIAGDDNKATALTANDVECWYLLIFSHFTVPDHLKGRGTGTRLLIRRQHPSGQVQSPVHGNGTGRQIPSAQ